ncbi:MAG TPA: hypothetical protein VL225_01985 [Vicinamibacterales bacterium]|nr:hypothetical protein [Vicinamibacterales bacterium]
MRPGRVSFFALYVLVVAALAGAAATAQTPPPPQQPPATAAPPQAPVAPLPAVPASRKFTSDNGIIFSVVKPDKTADFEMVMGRVKEALGKSQDPKRKQQALSWRVFKGLEAGPGGNVVYIWFLDPAVKDVEYTVTDILREAFPNEAQDLWSKYTACFVSGQTMLNLQQTTNMSPMATATVPK